MPDISYIFIWYLTILIIGLSVLPLTLNIFRIFVDRGYIFSKIIGIFLASYLMWLLGSLHIMPFTKISIFIILIFLAIINMLVFIKKNQKQGITLPWKWLLLEEVIFLACLSFWAFVRGNEPSIRGLEKFMDYGFVNSILKASYFPPLDMWLTKSPDYTGGYFINYYYFGHYISAFLTKLSAIDSAVTYNLMLATLFAFNFALSFSIGINLVYLLYSLKLQAGKIFQLNPVSMRFKLIITGLLSAFLITLAGNLHTVYVLTSGYPNESPKPFWQLDFGFHPERYWYPNATRFIPNTIHEFPIYSYVVADLHGHVSDIPFVLLIIALLLNLIISVLIKKTRQDIKTEKPSLWMSFLNDYHENSPIPLQMLFFLGVLIAVMYMTNAWDGLIYLILTGLTFLYLNFKIKKASDSLFTVFYKTASSSLFLIFFFLLANFPFMVNFRPFVSGIGVLCAPAFLLEKKIGPFLFETGKCQKSDLWMMSLLWGFFYYNVAGLFLFSINPFIGSLYAKIGSVSEKNNIFNRIRTEITRSINILKKSLQDLNPVDVFIVILIFLSTLLLIFPEFFYIKDIYPAHYRANTMFKLGYQAFMMLALVSSYVIIKLRLDRDKIKKTVLFTIYNTVLIFLLTLVAIYPYFAITSYYGKLKSYRGLDGIMWMRDQYNDDYQAILWLRENVRCPDGAFADCPNQPVIAEAVGDSYTDYARVSAYTGLPTVVGWPVHEWLWRGSYDEAGKRIPEVEMLYQSQDPEEAKNIIKKYNISYIFVGQLEREKYPQIFIEKFNDLAEVAYENSGTKIFKVHSSI